MKKFLKIKISPTGLKIAKSELLTKKERKEANEIIEDFEVTDIRIKFNILKEKRKFLKISYSDFEDFKTSSEKKLRITLDELNNPLFSMGRRQGKTVIMEEMLHNMLEDIEAHSNEFTPLNIEIQK